MIEPTASDQNPPTPYFQDESVTLYLGDCLDILPSITGVDLVVTSPPYNLGVTSGGGFGHYSAGQKRGGQGKWGGTDKGGIAYTDHDDAMPPAEYAAWHMNFAPTHYVPTHEWIVVFAKPGWRLKSKAASGIGDVWRVPQVANPDHPAPFPLGIPARAIETTAPGLVLDPFAGSGTTLRAAKDAGIRCIGIEKSERYCEVIAKRLSQGVLDFGAVS